MHMRLLLVLLPAFVLALNVASYGRLGRRGDEDLVTGGRDAAFGGPPHRLTELPLVDATLDSGSFGT